MKLKVQFLTVMFSLIAGLAFANHCNTKEHTSPSDEGAQTEASGAAAVLPAAEAVMAAATAEAAGETAEVNNLICPISGEEINPATASTVEYKGKIYQLCCAMCAKDFNKDPEAAIKKLEAGETTEAPAGSEHDHDHAAEQK